MCNRFYIIIFVLSCSIIFSSCSKKTNKFAESDNWYLSGSSESNYKIEKSTAEFNGKPVYHIICMNAADTGFGTIMKNIYSGTFTGKRIRLTGWIKTEKMSGSAAMWMRIDEGYGSNMYGSMLAFDNMNNRLITGNNDWKNMKLFLMLRRKAV